MSYIVKNCPAVQQGTCEKYGMCQNYTDCVIKQVIELCKHYKKHSDCGRDCPSFGRFLNKLLNEFDIEEINK